MTSITQQSPAPFCDYDMYKHKSKINIWHSFTNALQCTGRTNILFTIRTECAPLQSFQEEGTNIENEAFMSGQTSL